MNRTVTRREALGLAGAATGMLFAARGLALAQPLGHPLPTLHRLRLHRPEEGVVEAELVARPAALRVGGRSARLWTYNGSFPGPVLAVREGDHVRLRLTNELPEATNLHLHGLHVPPAVDDPFRAVPPGEGVVYEFEVPPGSRGVHW